MREYILTWMTGITIYLSLCLHYDVEMDQLISVDFILYTNKYSYPILLTFVCWTLN